ncbi:MAG: FAD-dependent thymidylate synthase [Alphaproteobacteria bacterium]|nr:FAD-dependent thymidylate synthase [Alphaproteobacteria bacterium]
MIVVDMQINPLTKIDGYQALMDIQRVAKTCYKTNKDTDDIESAKRIVKRLLDSGHHTMLEFYDITMNYVGNVAAYKDLRTHRHSVWAVESTRWCNYNKDKFGNEIKFLKPIELKPNTPEYEIWVQAMKNLESSYMEMAKLGCNPDQLSLLLPQSTAAEFNVRANLREWRHIFSLRSSVAATGHARPCVKQLMDPTLELFHKQIPVVFDDLYEKMKQNQR